MPSLDTQVGAMASPMGLRDSDSLVITPLRVIRAFPLPNILLETYKSSFKHIAPVASTTILLAVRLLAFTFYATDRCAASVKVRQYATGQAVTPKDALIPTGSPAQSISNDYTKGRRTPSLLLPLGRSTCSRSLTSWVSGRFMSTVTGARRAILHHSTSL